MNKKYVINYFLVLLKPYKKNIFFIVIGLILYTITTLTLPVMTQFLIDKGLIVKNTQNILFYSLLTLLITIVSVISNCLKEFYRINLSAKIEFELHSKAYEHLLNINIAYFKSHNKTEIYSNINTDVKKITSLFDYGIIFVISQLLAIIGASIGLFIIDFRLAIAVLLFIPIKFSIMRHLAIKRKVYTSNYIKNNKEYSSWFGDSIAGIKILKLYNLGKQKKKEFENIFGKLISSEKKMSLLDQVDSNMNTILIQFVIVMVYIMGGVLLLHSDMTIGSILTFSTYSIYILNPISSILSIRYMLSGITPSIGRMYEFNEIKEENTSANLKCDKDTKDIKIENLCVSYNNKSILKNITFKIDAGSKIAIVGHNGAGKSTIINVILRLADASSGTVIYDSRLISEYDLKSYRNLFSVVNQNVLLFNTSIKNNICLYKDFEDNLLNNVIEICGLRDLVNEKTLDYVVGDNGSALSGGQAQKIEFARALIHNRSILVLDEASSNADSYSEHILNEYILNELNEKTIIIVTHKLDILNKVDKIIYIDNGELICEGHYDDLIHNKKFYRYIYNEK